MARHFSSFWGEMTEMWWQFWQQAGGMLPRRQASLGAARREVTGGRDAPGRLRGAGLATWFLHQGRGRSAQRQRWGTLIVDAGGLGAGQAQADLGPAPEPLPKR